MTFDIQPAAGESIAGQVRARWDSLTKPPRSLGRLEDAVLQLALAQANPRPTLSNKSLHIFCGDHGVTAEGVSPYPSEVTRQMVLNFAAGGAAINVLCRKASIETFIIDAGVMGDAVPGALNHKVSPGTRNFAVEPAMTQDQAVQAIDTGAKLAASSQAHVHGVGEMGIGNTTSASALLCAFTGISPAEATGPGAGLNASGIRHKAEVVAKALALHQPDPQDPIAILHCLGGFEIAMMTGFLLGSAQRRIPVVMDGFISCAAALAATRISPAHRDYLFFSHRSAEPAHIRMLEALNAQPLLDLSMRLGEGTGAALAIQLLENALALYNEMATFEQAAVSNARSV